MKKILLLIPIVFLFFFMGCSAHTDLEPLPQGVTHMTVNLGGPIVKTSAFQVPVPYSTIGLQYGMGNKVNFDASLHILPFFYKLFAFDIGASLYFTENNGYVPVIGLHPTLLTFVSLKSNVDRMRVYPTIAVTSAWHCGADVVYTGFDYTVPLTRPDYDNDAPHVIFSPFVGYKLSLGKNSYLTTEFKWQAANVPSGQLAVGYVWIGRYGASAISIAFEKGF